jgi:hypothetical protein
VDTSGSQLGDDPDVAHLQPDPYAHLAALGERILAAPKGKPDYAAGREYSALKMRLDFGGTFHVHLAATRPPITDGTRPGTAAGRCGCGHRGGSVASARRGCAEVPGERRG